MNATAHFVLFGRPDKSGRERRLAGAAVCCCLLLMHSPRPYWAVGDAEEKRLMNQASAVFHTKENGRPGLLHEQMGKRRTTADSRRPWYVHVWLSKLLLMMMPTLYGKRSGICTPFTSAHVKRPIQGQSCHVTLTFFQNCRIGNFGEFNEPLLDFLDSKKKRKIPPIEVLLVRIDDRSRYGGLLGRPLQVQRRDHIGTRSVNNHAGADGAYRKRCDAFHRAVHMVFHTK